jgi:hypothetical protein
LENNSGRQNKHSSQENYNYFFGRKTNIEKTMILAEWTKTVVELFTTVVRGEKPKVKKTTEMVGAWKTNPVGRTNGTATKRSITERLCHKT